MGQYTDRPIKKCEQDTLGHRGYAEGVARAILQHPPETCMVYAIFGGWGTGKTSILYMIAEAIEKIGPANGTPIIVHFNPWLFSDQGTLSATFFNVIKREFGRGGHDQLAKDVGNLFDTMSKLAAPHLYMSLALKISGSISRIFPNTDLETTRDNIARILTNSQQRVVIVIDDIDRLTANEIRQIFLLVKSMADFPYVTYLLAFDDEIVTKALEEPTCGKGREYLEKIVQVQLPVPETSKSKLKRLVSKHLDAMIEDRGNSSWDQSYWRTVELAFWRPFRTMRGVYRYLNALDFNHAALKDEVCLVDLWCLTLLQVFYPETYHWICCHKEFLVQEWTTRLSEGLPINEPENKQKIEARFNELLLTFSSNTARHTIGDMIKQMFPAVGRVIGDIGMSVSEISLRAAKRIGTPENVDRYFFFGLSEDEVSHSQLENVVESMTDIQKLSEVFDKLKSKQDDLFVRLEDMTRQLNEQQARNFIRLILRRGDDLVKSDDMVWGNAGSIFRLVNTLLKDKIEQTKRYDILELCTANWSHGIMVCSDLVLYWDNEHQSDSQNYVSHPESRTLSEDNIYKLKKRIGMCISQGTQSGELQKYRFRLRILYYWYHRFGGEIESRETVVNMCNTDIKLLEFLRENTKLNYSHISILAFFEKKETINRLEKILLDLRNKAGNEEEIRLIEGYLNELRAVKDNEIK